MSNRTKEQALDVLRQHKLDIDRLNLLLSQAPPNQILTLSTEEADDEWSFTLRRRSRLFLMAKNKFMNKYEEIAVSSK